ncbi:MAG: type II toxin-antitoxin system VapC family toxin [Candidatus Woesearchaeota archaeon]
MKLLYLNANILYGECLKKIQKRSWRRLIKTGVLENLENYSFFTSTLTKMEIIQRLVRDENIHLDRARKLFSQIVREFNVTQISSLNKLNLLTNTFIDNVLSSNLDFKDALHLEIASKYKLDVLTHDKKFLKNHSQHKDKEKFYSRVYKSDDLFDD